MSRLPIIDQRRTAPEAERQSPPRFWRSIDQLAAAPGFRQQVAREHPRFAAEWTADLDRRRFLQLSSASLALAGLAGCTRQPFEEIVPYVRQPEQVVPGKPLYFATSLALGGYAVPVLAESHQGRPTKLDGNPEHPASLGKSDIFTQAALADLYDPDRLQAVMNQGTIRTWKAARERLSHKMTALTALGGQGLRILTGTVTSPTQSAQLARLLEALPEARWHRYDGLHRDALYTSTQMIFGRPLEVRYDLRAADVVVALESDLLTTGPGAVRHAADFAARRRVDGEAAMSRLYAIDTAPSATSAAADHRMALRPWELGALVRMLAARVGLLDVSNLAGFGSDERVARFVNALGRDLRAARGRSLVVGGERLAPEAQVLVHAMNALLGNVGATVHYTEPVPTMPGDHTGSLAALTEDMQAGKVDTLVVLGANPVYDAPADLDVAGAMAAVPLTVSLTSRVDETAKLCQWQLPEAHELERWGDGRAFDGTITLQQPLIEPLYGGKSAIELLAILLGESTVSAREQVRAQHAALDERAWRRAVHDGFIAGSAAPAVVAEAKLKVASALAASLGEDGGFELAFRLDPTILDGRFANNGWLQECPKPVSKLTWDNALLLSPRTYRELGLGEPFSYGDQGSQAPVVRVVVDGRALEAPAWALPGHADGCATLNLGYGRTDCGRVGKGAGVNANLLRSRAHLWRVSDAEIIPTGVTSVLATTQDHHAMEGRDLVRMATLAAYQADPQQALAPEHGEVDASRSIMDRSAGWKYDSYAWGMTLDLNACTGCNACVIACQAENNIPIVGKDQVSRGREMHWIRVDRYFSGEHADLAQSIVHQPVPCMQCEQAPCEVVCPVAATVHSDEGLNDMVYNRCVGTRYCSNNCPYKVRRFNFLLYADFDTPQLKLGRNPDVTVRSRGVMEKCTYCVQRINQARISAKREQRSIRDGEITTACQSACPSDAIVFGDLNDPQSAVSRSKASPRSYLLLEELGTRPRTSYLARIHNAHPALTPPSPARGPGHEEARG